MHPKCSSVLFSYIEITWGVVISIRDVVFMVLIN